MKGTKAAQAASAGAAAAAACMGKIKADRQQRDNIRLVDFFVACCQKGRFLGLRVCGGCITATYCCCYVLLRCCVVLLLSLFVFLCVEQSKGQSCAADHSIALRSLGTGKYVGHRASRVRARVVFSSNKHAPEEQTTSDGG